MIESAVVKCDVCGQPIPRGVPYCKLPVHIPADLRAAIAAEFKAGGALAGDVPAPLRMLNLVADDDMAPRHWTCEVDYGCLFGFLPQLLEAMRTQIPRYLTLRKEAQARAAQYQADLDEE